MRAKIRRISTRFRLEVLERIRGEAFQDHPRDGSVQGIGIGGRALYRRRCPRVELMILPRGRASAQGKAWAKTIARRYGPRRVVVRRGEAQLREGPRRPHGTRAG